MANESTMRSVLGQRDQSVRCRHSQRRHNRLASHSWRVQTRRVRRISHRSDRRSRAFHRGRSLDADLFALWFGLAFLWVSCGQIWPTRYGWFAPINERHLTLSTRSEHLVRLRIRRKQILVVPACSNPMGCRHRESRRDAKTLALTESV